VDLDLRQDGDGPVLTKIEALIWNEFESSFSGTRRCICCWDQTMLSNWSRSTFFPNHFMLDALDTDKGKARLTAEESDECEFEEICGLVDRRIFPDLPGRVPRRHALLGLATKFIAFSGNLEADATAGMNLVGAGARPARITVDTEEGGTEELRTDLRSRSDAKGRSEPESSKETTLRRPLR
jgi:hypothetical protein